MANRPRRDLLDDLFTHLATPPDAANPIEAARSHADNYGRGEVGKGLSQCRIHMVQIGGCAGEWLVPPEAVPGKRLVHLHGGGWIAGSLASHRAMLAELAVATQASVLAIDYRLAPEHPFPAGLQDCVAAFDHAARFGPDGAETASHLWLSGDSAGGNLAAAAVLQMIQAKARLPDRLVLMSPFLATGPCPTALASPLRDPVVSLDGMAQVRSFYAPETSPHDPLVEPLRAAPDLLARFPPCLIQVSSAEALRDQAISFADQLWANGVEARISMWPGLPHVWQIFVASSPDARNALTEAACFLAAN